MRVREQERVPVHRYRRDAGEQARAGAGTKGLWIQIWVWHSVHRLAIDMISAVAMAGAVAEDTAGAGLMAMTWAK